MGVVSDLISQGYGGYAGWGEAEAAADFKATGGSGGKYTGPPRTAIFPTGGQSFNPQDFIKALEESQAKSTAAAKVEREALLKEQEAKESAFVGRYQEAITGLEPVSAIAKRVSEELGIPSFQGASRFLNEEIINLEGILGNLPGRVAQETRGFDVSASQLARLQESRGIPFRQQLVEVARNAARIGGTLASLQTQMGETLQFEAEEQRRKLLPFQVEADFLSQRLAREITLYSDERQRDLDGLLGKLNAGVTLSIAEADRAANLAIKEAEFALKSRELSSGVLTTGQGGRTLLVNPQSGAIISDLGLAAAPKAGGGASNIGGYLGGGTGGGSGIQNNWNVTPQQPSRTGGFGTPPGRQPNYYA